MIGYSLLDDEPLSGGGGESPVMPAPAPPQHKIFNFMTSGEDTECNYLVMFFIFGVFMLAASDSLR